MGFIDVMASTAGRWLRVVAGVGLIALGLLAVRGVAGIIVAIVGVIPMAAGIFDFCIFAPLAGLPFFGPAIRTQRTRPDQH